ncbi:MAG: hypothetical protein U0411_12980 [Thermodesulfovibrionales bacterium]
MEQKTGTVATMALIAAAVSYLLTFSGHPIFGFVAALAAILLGIFGLVVAASPRVGGGLLSSIALALGVLAIGISVLGLIGVILF